MFNWAVLLWGEVKCWSFSFSLFSGLLWNCTENNTDYSRKTPASPNDWCKLTNHWWHSLFFHPPLLGHFNFYIFFLASFTKPPSWKDKKLMMFKGSEYCTLFFAEKYVWQKPIQWPSVSPMCYTPGKAKLSLSSAWWPVNRGDNNGRTLVGTAKRWPLNRGLISHSFLQLP